MIRFTVDNLLTSREWSSYRLAQETGLREDTIGKYRRNEVRRPILEHLNAMCAAFRCGIGDLMEYVPDKAVKAPRSKKR